MTGELAIRLGGVVKRYGSIVAVDHLDLEVPMGTCVGLLGPNGASETHKRLCEPNRAGYPPPLRPPPHAGARGVA